MHCAGLEGEEAEPHELFVALGVLIVEGRVPGASERGYGEGPHCPALGAKQRAVLPHQCDTATNLLCRREVEFRKRMLLLWQSGVPMTVEVLVCPECTCGAQRAQSPEPSVRPSPSDLLLEQWTITALPHGRGEEGAVVMGVRALLQAVRSQLFFSQLGAWLSSSDGRAPRHICYRLTVPGEPFASHFQRPPTEHSFPSVSIGRNANKVTFKVSLKSLPRGEAGAPPKLPCCRTSHENTGNVVSTESAAPSTSTTSTVSTAHTAKENTSTAVQRKLSREEERGAELDGPLLGESLLDPPQRRERWSGVGGGAGRYQSPSQRASPSLDSPEHLLFLPPENPVDGIMPEEGQVSSQQSRVGRQGLARRRDARRERGLLDDRMHTACTRQGKHHCCQDPQEEEASTSSQEGAAKLEPEAGASSGVKSKSEATLDPKQGKLGSKLNLSQREVEEVLAVLRYRARPVSPPLNSLPKSSDTNPLAVSIALTKGPHQCLEKLPTYLEKESSTPLSKEMLSKKSSLEMEGPVEPDGTKADRLLEAILRPSKESVQEQVDSPAPQQQQQAANHKPTGLERLKHLFNKTISVPNKENTPPPPTEVAGAAKAQVPSALDKAQFRRSLDSAASMVFRSGLPLTSSPAPVRRGTCFDFDSSLNSVQAIRSALFESQSPVSPAASSCGGDDESCQASPDVESPPSPITARPYPKPSWSPTSGALLGTFEESVLNGRLEPVSTVHGFTAELGASGSFCPKHLRLPVTVFFYTLGDNDKVSTPYLGHINLGKKGYNVPRSGTVQVTLFNPLGTVVKMFVVAYDLSDMPPCSQTFLRQRTLYLPASTPGGGSTEYLPHPSPPATQRQWEEESSEHSNLRYLIHLRFSSSKSGRIYLHSDVRMIIFRKSDQDTASAHAGAAGESSGAAHELRSFISGPSKPKFSPRK